MGFIVMPEVKAGGHLRHVNIIRVMPLIVIPRQVNRQSSRMLHPI